jgi:hypothetical protein
MAAAAGKEIAWGHAHRSLLDDAVPEVGRLIDSTPRRRALRAVVGGQTPRS